MLHIHNLKYKNWNTLIVVALTAVIFSSCSKEEEIIENNKPQTTEETSATGEFDHLQVEDFVYRGMNEIYLYKAQVPELADSYFSNQNEKFDYLETFSTPEKLFDELTASEDKFSFITDNYNELEDSFNGISGSTGMKYGLGRISGTNNLFGYLRYVLPGTSAEAAGLERGTVFTEVDGQKLTMNNFQKLLGKDSFTINIGEVVNGEIQLSGETAELTDDPYTANPVYIAKTINMDGQKIGYLMYNSFIGDFDDELNAAFADFKAQGITDLVLDLRYNGGGSVVSATDLASMITGQFEGEIFMKEQWNAKYQNFYEANDPERLINRFDSELRDGAAINSLNLNKVYVLTTASTASASELVINGLEPYIDVVQIGENTTGKFQASVTLYDSPDFSKDNINEDHTYALQPLVFKSINADGTSDYVNGLSPDVSFTEDLSNLGTLGDTEEPLLAAALNEITGRAQTATGKGSEKFQKFEVEGLEDQRMYIEEIPTIPNQ